MNLTEKKYDAFISYRHSELDQFVAVTLHKELENFRIPRNMNSQLNKQGITKRRISRVFRDRDELPITNNLADPITEALKNSEYLLVICSPRLRDSIWCHTEIETYIKMHGRDHVFAVLVEGEPDESFPEEILYKNEIETDENGNQVERKIQIEPLAADVRGKTKREIRKKIKEEVVRLASPMFGCSYDDLKQRHREQKIKRILSLALMGCTIFASFAIISGIMSFRIHNQSVKIQEQSEKIEEQYLESRTDNAKAISKNALEQLEMGNQIGAVKLAYGALTKDEQGNMPYTSEAENALSQSLRVYRSGNKIVPHKQFVQNSEVSFMCVSPNQEYMLSEDIYGTISVWKPASGEKIFQTTLEGKQTYLQDEDICFAGNDSIIYKDEVSCYIYNLNEKKIIEIPGRVLCVSSDKDGKFLLALKKDSFYLYDIALERKIMEKELQEGCLTSTKMAFSNEADYAAFEYEDGNENAFIEIININNGENLSFDTKYEHITALMFSDDNLYYAAYSGMPVSESVLCSVSLNGKLQWSQMFEDSYIATKLRPAGKNQEYIACKAYNRLIILDRQTGTIICRTDAGSEIINFGVYLDSDFIAYMTRNGEFHYYDIASNEDTFLLSKFTTNSDNIKEFEFGKGYYLSCAYNDVNITEYEYTSGSKLEKVYKFDFVPLDYSFSTDESLMAVEKIGVDQKQIQIVNIKEHQISSEINFEDHILDFCFFNQDTIAVLTPQEILFYSIDGSNLLKRISYSKTTKEAPFMTDGQFIKNGEYAVLKDYDGIYILECNNGKYAAQKLINDIRDNGQTMLAYNNDCTKYAYISEEKKKIMIGSWYQDTLIEIPGNVDFVASLSFDEKGEKLYVAKLDNSVECYNCEDGKIIRTYTKFDYQINCVKEIEKWEQTYLETNQGAYILNKDYEIIGFVEGFQDVLEESRKIVLLGGNTVYTVPVYSKEMLCKEAEQFIKENESKEDNQND